MIMPGNGQSNRGGKFIACANQPRRRRSAPSPPSNHLHRRPPWPGHLHHDLRQRHRRRKARPLVDETFQRQLQRQRNDLRRSGFPRISLHRRHVHPLRPRRKTFSRRSNLENPRPRPAANPFPARHRNSHGQLRKRPQRQANGLVKNRLDIPPLSLRNFFLLLHSPARPHRRPPHPRLGHHGFPRLRLSRQQGRAHHRSPFHLAAHLHPHRMVRNPRPYRLGLPRRLPHLSHLPQQPRRPPRLHDFTSLPLH